MKKRKNYDELLSLINDLQQRITELNNKNEKLQEEKNDLKKQLELAEQISKNNQIINMTIKEKSLPKCESELCTNCAHCVTQMVDGQKRIIGCRKDIDCADYMPKPEVIPVPYPLSVPPLPDYNSWTIMNYAARMMNGRLV